MTGRQQHSDPEPEGPVYVDEDHQRIAEFADDYFDEDEREGFVDHLMERRGYQRIQSWGPRADPDPEPDPEPEPRGGSRRPGGRGGRPGYFKR